MPISEGNCLLARRRRSRRRLFRVCKVSLRMLRKLTIFQIFLLKPPPRGAAAGGRPAPLGGGGGVAPSGEGRGGGVGGVWDHCLGSRCLAGSHTGPDCPGDLSPARARIT